MIKTEIATTQIRTNYMVTVYGIKNCYSIKKARNWLEQNNIDYTFHDVRENPLTRGQVDHWLKVLGSENIINKRGTTWRQLTTSEQEGALAGGQAASLIIANPTLFKRPVIELNDHIEVGFNPLRYETLFSA